MVTALHLSRYLPQMHNQRGCLFSQYCSRIGPRKNERDDFMIELHRKSPEYGWDRNKGYPPKNTVKTSSLLVCHYGIEKVLHYCPHKRNSTFNFITFVTCAICSFTLCFLR